MSDFERIKNQARSRQYRKEDQDDLAQETWLKSIASGMEHEAKYMTNIMKNTLLKSLIKKTIAKRNMFSLVQSMYSNDNSLKNAHLKNDIIKCYGFLNKKQCRIIDVIASNPEGTHKEWADALGLDRRNFTYHLLNVRHIFKSLLNENTLPTNSYGYIQDPRYDEVGCG